MNGEKILNGLDFRLTHFWDHDQRIMFNMFILLLLRKIFKVCNVLIAGFITKYYLIRNCNNEAITKINFIGI